MKHYFYICISALLLAGATPMQAQTKSKAKAKSTTQTKAKSGNTKNSAASSAKILYVEPEDPPSLPPQSRRSRPSRM